jgi:adenylosuccinate synthase
VLKECRPVYEELTGWQSDLSGVTSFDQLPKRAAEYIEKLEDVTGCPIVLVSVGPRRDQTIQLANPFA